MLSGMSLAKRVVESSLCRLSEDDYLSDVTEYNDPRGDFKIHATTLMSEINFGLPLQIPESIPTSIFINDADTKLSFNSTIKVQNYLTTHFVGRAPFMFYGPKTKAGAHKFRLVCKGGDPSYLTRYFGTEGAVGGNNQDANPMTSYSRV